VTLAAQEVDEAHGDREFVAALQRLIRWLHRLSAVPRNVGLIRRSQPDQH
jgi:hypothetical protein